MKNPWRFFFVSCVFYCSH